MSPRLIKQAVKLQGRVIEIIVELAEACLEEGRVTKIVSYGCFQVEGDWSRNNTDTGDYGKEGSALGTPRFRVIYLIYWVKGSVHVLF